MTEQTLRNYLEQRLEVKTNDAEETKISELLSRMCKNESEAGNHLGAKHLGNLTLIIGSEEQKRRTLEIFEIPVIKEYKTSKKISELVDDYMNEQGYQTFETIAGEISPNCRWDEYFNDQEERKRVEYLFQINSGKADALKIQLFEMEK
ncbi:MAG: hypothetical protein AABW79_01625 [Nanoarchaeota archaeon]